MLHILTHPLLCGHMQISLSSCPYQYTWQIWAVFEPPSPCSREEGRWGQAERQLESGQFQLFPFECCWRWLGENRVRGLRKGRRWCWQGESSVLARCYRGGYVPTLLQSGFNVESHRARLLGLWWATTPLPVEGNIINVDFATRNGTQSIIKCIFGDSRRRQSSGDCQGEILISIDWVATGYFRMVLILTWFLVSSAFDHFLLSWLNNNFHNIISMCGIYKIRAIWSGLGQFIPIST